MFAYRSFVLALAGLAAIAPTGPAFAQAAAAPAGIEASIEACGPFTRTSDRPARPDLAPFPTPGVTQGGVTTVDGVNVLADRRTVNVQYSVLPVSVSGSGSDERYPHATAHPVRLAVREPLSTFSIDVDTASYANTRRFLQDGELPPADAVRVEEMLNYFDYNYAAPADAAHPFRLTTAVTRSPWSPGRVIVHIGLQGFEPAERSVQPPLNLVFLVDTSGSMQSPDKLELAVSGLNMLVGRLRPQDHVAIVAYAGSAGAVLEPTPGDQQLRIRCALRTLNAGGSTAGGEGLELAYRLAERNFDPHAVNRVILMTDGDFNVGVTSDEGLRDIVVRHRTAGVYLSVYGFGRGNYNDTMMQAIAQNGNGVAAYVDSQREARRLFTRDLDAALFPIANDVKVQVRFDPLLVHDYRLIGYETRDLRNRDFQDDSVDAGDVGTGASVTAVYEITPEAGAGGALAFASLGVRGGQAMPLDLAGRPIAEVRIRYRPPSGGPAHTLYAPIGGSSAYGRLARAPESTRWAVAVSAFGQQLRHDPYLSPRFGYAETSALAESAVGDDPDGDRAEFVRLIQAAAEARPIDDGEDPAS